VIYYTALIIVTVGALFNRSAFPYALVLCAVWGAFWALQRAGLYDMYPWVDAASIYPLSFLTAYRPRWWNLTIVGLCFATVLSHLVFWTAYYSDVYLGSEYTIALRALFLLSMATALLGNLDVKRLVGAVVECVLGLLRGNPSGGLAHGHRVPVDTKEALGDHIRSYPVCRIQPRQHGVGYRKTSFSHRAEEARNKFSGRSSDGRADRSLHISQTGG